MVNKGSHFADFVRFRPHTYNLYAYSTISAALMGGNKNFAIIIITNRLLIITFIITLQEFILMTAFRH